MPSSSYRRRCMWCCSASPWVKSFDAPDGQFWKSHCSSARRRWLLHCRWSTVGLDVLVAGAGAAMPAFAGFWMVLGGLLGLASGVLYFIGFAPPVWLRRAWQEPAVRAFLGRGAQLLGETDTLSAVRDLEDRTA